MARRPVRPGARAVRDRHRPEDEAQDDPPLLPRVHAGRDAPRQRDLAPRQEHPSKITGFVGGTRNPPPVPDAEVRRITKMLDDEEEPKPVLDFEVGEEVRLTEGPTHPCAVCVEEINESRGKLRVVINMFGRPVSAPSSASTRSRSCPEPRPLQPSKRRQGSGADSTRPRRPQDGQETSTMAKKVVNHDQAADSGGPGSSGASGWAGTRPGRREHQAVLRRVQQSRTKEQAGDGLIIPVVITVYADRSFSFITKTPPVAGPAPQGSRPRPRVRVSPTASRSVGVTMANRSKRSRGIKMPDLNCTIAGVGRGARWSEPLARRVIKVDG